MGQYLCIINSTARCKFHVINYKFETEDKLIRCGNGSIPLQLHQLEIDQQMEPLHLAPLADTPLILFHYDLSAFSVKLHSISVCPLRN